MGTEIFEGHKETPVGVIPEDWDVAKLGDKKYFKVIMGQSPSSSTYNGHGNGLPFLQGNADFGFIYPYPSLYCSNPLKIAEENDILISVRAPVGEVNLSPTKVCIGRGLSAIRPKNGANTKFFFYYLKISLDDFNKLSSGSTFKAINKTDIESHFVPLPPISEQRKIAAILSSVDAAIHETDAIIAQTEQVKRGLMQELFTKGIGHAEFRETKVGRIPLGWKTVKIDELKSKKRHAIAMGPFGSDITVDNFKLSGIPVIRGVNLTSHILNDANFVFVNEAKADELGASNAYRRDIVLTHRGTIGQVSIIPDNSIYKRYVVSQSQMKLTCDEAIVNPYFVNFYLNSPVGQKRLLSYKAHTGVPAIGQPITSLKKLKMPLPPRSEQDKISQIIDIVWRNLEAERQHRSRLETVKKGLMQDLLTGKKRVKVDGHA